MAETILIVDDEEPIRRTFTEWLRGLIGVVPQQTFLFAGTIEANIRLGRPEASESDLLAAAKAAHFAAHAEAKARL